MSGLYFHCLFLFYRSAMNETKFVFWKLDPGWEGEKRKGTTLVKVLVRKISEPETAWQVVNMGVHLLFIKNNLSISAPLTVRYDWSVWHFWRVLLKGFRVALLISSKSPTSERLTCNKGTKRSVLKVINSAREICDNFPCFLSSARLSLKGKNSSNVIYDLLLAAF